jgi:hypothetical protein
MSPARDKLPNQKDDEQGKENPGKGDAGVNAGKAKDPQHEKYSY